MSNRVSNLKSADEYNEDYPRIYWSKNQKIVELVPLILSTPVEKKPERVPLAPILQNRVQPVDRRDGEQLKRKLFQELDDEPLQQMVKKATKPKKFKPKRHGKYLYKI